MECRLFAYGTQRYRSSFLRVKKGRSSAPVVRRRAVTVARRCARVFSRIVSARTRETILAIVATDTTFVRARYGEGEAFIGKCLHCGGRLVIDLDGTALSRATIEHILPRAHGGTDALENLGLACARCNSEKGVRHDSRATFDGRLAEVVHALVAKRMERWRPPSDELRARHERYLLRRSGGTTASTKETRRAKKRR